MIFPNADKTIDLGHLPASASKPEEREDVSALSSPLTSPQKAPNTAVTGLDFRTLHHYQPYDPHQQDPSPAQTP